MKKASRYNHFIMHNNSVIAYNARTNALAELEKEIYESFKNVLVITLKAWIQVY